MTTPPGSPGSCPAMRRPKAWLDQGLRVRQRELGSAGDGTVGLNCVNSVAVTDGERIWNYGGRAVVRDGVHGDSMLSRRPNQLSCFTPATGEVRSYSLRDEGGACCIARNPSRGSCGIYLSDGAVCGGPSGPAILVYGGLASVPTQGGMDVSRVQKDLFLVMLPPVGCAETTEFACVNVTARGCVSDLFGHSMLYDRALRRVVIFGGFDGVGDVDTVRTASLTKSGCVFTKPAITASEGTPQGRCFHVCQWLDDECNAMWLWGGFGVPRSSNQGTYPQGEWVLDTQRWTWRKLPGGSFSPCPRQAAAHCLLATDGRRQVLVHGGYSASRVCSDWSVYDLETKLWDAPEWEVAGRGTGAAEQPPDGPSATPVALRRNPSIVLKGHQLVAARGAAWMFGGQTAQMEPMCNSPSTFPDILYSVHKPHSLKYLAANFLKRAGLSYTADVPDDFDVQSNSSRRCLVSPRVSRSEAQASGWGRLVGAFVLLKTPKKKGRRQHTDNYESAACEQEDEPSAAGGGAPPAMHAECFYSPAAMADATDEFPSAAAAPAVSPKQRGDGSGQRGSEESGWFQGLRTLMQTAGRSKAGGAKDEQFMSERADAEAAPAAAAAGPAAQAAGAAGPAPDGAACSSPGSKQGCFTSTGGWDNDLLSEGSPGVPSVTNAFPKTECFESAAAQPQKPHPKPPPKH
eukprot:TRINITY_DN5987_c0_g1_i1.p1 TRINITY_DN5987_c0_g1~~TRINITY_DN5987_c0_g1_i1.p1  ORF type:complete len:686 (+),score=116.51 TRINITY_DN5987_c0_g1_i1:70-2127(+)